MRLHHCKPCQPDATILALYITASLMALVVMKVMLVFATRDSVTVDPNHAPLPDTIQQAATAAAPLDVNASAGTGTAAAPAAATPAAPAAAAPPGSPLRRQGPAVSSSGGGSNGFGLRRKPPTVQERLRDVELAGRRDQVANEAAAAAAAAEAARRWFAWPPHRQTNPPLAAHPSVGPAANGMMAQGFVQQQPAPLPVQQQPSFASSSRRSSSGLSTAHSTAALLPAATANGSSSASAAAYGGAANGTLSSVHSGAVASAAGSGAAAGGGLQPGGGGSSGGSSSPDVSPTDIAKPFVMYAQVRAGCACVCG